jgi:thioredoxin-related protein
MKIAMVMENGDQKKNFEHILIVDKEEAAILLLMAEAYCNLHKRSMKPKKLLKEFQDNFSIY